MIKYCPFTNSSCQANCQFAKTVPSMMGFTHICSLSNLSDQLDTIITLLSKQNH